MLSGGQMAINGKIFQNKNSSVISGPMGTTLHTKSKSTSENQNKNPPSIQESQQYSFPLFIAVEIVIGSELGSKILQEIIKL